MTNPLYTGHPFGTTVTEETLRAIFLPLTQWEDKYRQLILLGKQLPALPDECKAQAKEIAGCENRVWLGFTRSDNGTMHFFGDSEGRIVRGLLAVLLTAVEGKTPPSCRLVHRWRCLMSWVYAPSLAPHVVRG
ncbi:CsdA-binding activator [Salmonella enterica subsp. enterica serovar Newport str. WA_14881]|nr:CsdA-binding activator [Salmonella enterica subsp. enterica serovar Newport str. WA_14881]